MAVRPDDGGPLVEVAGAATHLGVSEAFVRRLVLKRRVRYFKVGKFVGFRAADLDAFVEAGRHDPVEPWVHPGSPLRRVAGLRGAQQRGAAGRRGSVGRA